MVCFERIRTTLWEIELHSTQIKLRYFSQQLIIENPFWYQTHSPFFYIDIFPKSTYKWKANISMVPHETRVRRSKTLEYFWIHNQLKCDILNHRHRSRFYFWVCKSHCDSIGPVFRTFNCWLMSHFRWYWRDSVRVYCCFAMDYNLFWSKLNFVSNYCGFCLNSCHHQDNSKVQYAGHYDIS